MPKYKHAYSDLTWVMTPVCQEKQHNITSASTYKGVIWSRRVFFKISIWNYKLCKNPFSKVALLDLIWPETVSRVYPGSSQQSQDFTSMSMFDNHQFKDSCKQLDPCSNGRMLKGKWWVHCQWNFSLKVLKRTQFCCSVTIVYIWIHKFDFWLSLLVFNTIKSWLSCCVLIIVKVK